MQKFKNYAKQRFYEKLLKKHDSLIHYGARLYSQHSFRSNTWKSHDDLAQELRQLLWESIDKVNPVTEKSVLKMFKTCMYRFINTEIGKNFLKKNQARHIYNIDAQVGDNSDSHEGLMVDPFTNHYSSTNVFSNENVKLKQVIEDESIRYRNQKFLEYLEKRNVDKTAIAIYKLLIFKPKDFIDCCNRINREKNKHSYRIRQTHLAEYLNLSDVKISLSLKKLRKVCNEWKKNLD